VILQLPYNTPQQLHKEVLDKHHFVQNTTAPAKPTKYIICKLVLQNITAPAKLVLQFFLQYLQTRTTKYYSICKTRTTKYYSICKLVPPTARCMKGAKMFNGKWVSSVHRGTLLAVFCSTLQPHHGALPALTILLSRQVQCLVYAGVNSPVLHINVCNKCVTY
jgi:hypothetical protein